MSSDTPNILATYQRILEQQGYKPTTVYQRIRLLGHLGVSPDQATRADVLRVMDMAHKSSSRRVYLNGLKIAYRDLLELGLVEHDPTIGLRSPAPPRGKPRPLTAVEIAKLLNLTGRELSWTILGLRAGLRAAEVTRVKPADLQMTDQGWVLHIPVGKGGGWGTIPAHPDVVDILQPLAGYDRALWPIRPARLSVAWTEAAEGVGVTGRRFHDLRHTFASQVYAQTGDLYVTQQLMRHASIATTTIYAQPDQGRQFQAVAGL